MGIINGYSSPAVKIIPAAENSPEAEIKVELPLTNSAGLVESYEIKKISHELISFGQGENKIINAQKILGYIITFTLHYNKWLDGKDLYTGIKQIIDAAKAGRKLILIPRNDAPWREFEVILSNNTFELGINKGGRYASTHRLAVLEFKSANLEPDLKWYPPEYAEPCGGTGLPIEGSP
ncbi:MAG: hypothetical protein IT280_06355 [Ignavibacteria bacterium]|nr:hypothetical protein [Ignavibacteria bacterium]